VTHILAIDPATRATGWAVWSLGDRPRCHAAGTVTATRLGLLPGKIRRVIGRARGIAGPRAAVQLAIERPPPTHRSDNPADLWGPGFAGGIWLGIWAGIKDTIADPILVPVGDWRPAMLGPRRKWLYDDPKKMANLVALQTWADHRVQYEGAPSVMHNAAEATLIGEFVAKGCPVVVGRTVDRRGA